MEEKEVKVKKDKSIWIILLVGILVIALGCCITYIYTMSKTLNNDNIMTLEETEHEKNTMITDNVQKEESIVSESNKENKNTNSQITSDERYSIYIKGLKKSISSLKNSGVSPDGETVNSSINIMADPAIMDSIGIGCITIYYDGKAELGLEVTSTLGKKYGAEYELGSNILKAGMSWCGNGDDLQYVWYITDSGDLYSMLISSTDNKLKFKKETKLKNIVDIITVGDIGGQSPMAIDIDGKMYDIME